MSQPAKVPTYETAIPPDTFAVRLVVLRHTRGRLSQEAAAERCKVNPKTWATWELGRKPQRMDEVVRRIAKNLGCDEHWLMFGGPLEKSAYFSVVPTTTNDQLVLPGIVKPALAVAS